MQLIRMMDSLLRNRAELYQQASEGHRLGGLCVKLLLIFIITCGLYGMVMGGFRWLHPEFFFSDYIIDSPADEAPRLRGKVLAVEEAERKVFIKGTTPQFREGMTIRFNQTDPSEPYPVTSVGEEQGYKYLQLGGEGRLHETDTAHLPLLVGLKIPLLFLATLLLCSLALYVLNLAFGLGLHFLPTMTLLVFALAAIGIMLGVFIPIAAFFTVVTSNYHFIKLMHFCVFAIAGLFGVKVLWEGLTKMASPDAKGRSFLLLASWLLLYCLMGSQLAWTLKPFLGTPYLPATPPFRVESGNIYVNAFQSLGKMVDR